MSRVAPSALAALCLVAFTGVAHAQTGPGPAGSGAKLDANGDGTIGAAEFDQAARLRFQRMDGNQDGVVDAGELAAMKTRMEARRAEAGKGPAKGPDRLARMDADQDGRITQAEALALSQARFAKLDKNGDGGLDAAEQEAMAPARAGGPK